MIRRWHKKSVVSISTLLLFRSRNWRFTNIRSFYLIIYILIHYPLLFKIFLFNWSTSSISYYLRLVLILSLKSLPEKLQNNNNTIFQSTETKMAKFCIEIDVPLFWHKYPRSHLSPCGQFSDNIIRSKSWNRRRILRDLY